MLHVYDMVCHNMQCHDIGLQTPPSIIYNSSENTYLQIVVLHKTNVVRYSLWLKRLFLLWFSNKRFFDTEGH